MEHFLTHEGYLALGLLALIQACCIPIPSEITLGFAGVLAGQGRLSLAVVIVIGTAAELAGSLVAYSVGRRGGRPLVDRVGRYLLIGPHDLDRAERWLAGRGEWAVAVGRALPVVRAFASVAAGIGQMRLRQFAIFSFLGTLVYVVAMSLIGYGVGSNWHRVAHDFSLAGYAILAVIVIGIAALALHRVRSLRTSRSTPLASVVVAEEE